MFCFKRKIVLLITLVIVVLGMSKEVQAQEPKISIETIQEKVDIKDIRQESKLEEKEIKVYDTKYKECVIEIKVVKEIIKKEKVFKIKQVKDTISNYRNMIKKYPSIIIRNKKMAIKEDNKNDTNNKKKQNKKQEKKGKQSKSDVADLATTVKIQKNRPNSKAQSKSIKESNINSCIIMSLHENVVSCSAQKLKRSIKSVDLPFILTT